MLDSFLLLGTLAIYLSPIIYVSSEDGAARMIKLMINAHLVVVLISFLASLFLYQWNSNGVMVVSFLYYICNQNHLKACDDDDDDDDEIFNKHLYILYESYY